MAILNAGKAVLAGLAGNTGSQTAFTALAYGTDGTTVAVTDTTMTGESQRAAATVTRATTTVTNDTLQLTHTFSITSTETIRKVGVVNNATSGGDFLAMYVLPAARSAIAGDTYALTSTVAFA
jgi:protein-disulfide isomerase